MPGMATTSPPAAARSRRPEPDLDHVLPALLQRAAGDVSAAASSSALRAVRRRLVRLSRRRRLSQSLGTGTLAAGLFTGGAHQLWGHGQPGTGVGSGTLAAPAADLPAASPEQALPAPGDSPTTPATSWSWDTEERTDRMAADPGALYAGGTFHVYTTSARHCVDGACADLNVPRFTSPDLAQPGRLTGDAMPTRPAWVSARHPEIWAPQVAQIDGRYVLYFAATADRGGMKCLGAAVAPGPEGPFAPLDQPLHCTPGYWAIDPYPVADGDRWYLLWRQDDPDHPTGKVVAAELRPDGLGLAATPPTTLLVGEQPWEDGGRGIGPLENPAMVRHPATGEWLLAWSANLWQTQDYATGLATCDGPLGPCRRAGDATTPWLRTSADLASDTSSDGDTSETAGAGPSFGGAGGLSFVAGPDGALYAVFHAYAGSGEHPAAPRVAWTARVDAVPGAAATNGGSGRDSMYRLVGIAGNHSDPASVRGV
jgi:hypothetical protein